MDYQILLNDGAIITLNQTSDFNSDGTFTKFKGSNLVSIKVGDSLLSLNTITAILPVGDALIDLDYELTLHTGLKVSKGTHNQIDLFKVDNEINKEAFFEFGGGLFNRNLFNKIVPNPAKQQTA
ncbi:hypothetical protein [Lysinibacillus sp. SGAir0095]|uniref:hypothetical protein n=1 Tax=Lysinibacillus sp. SGAir0095 TaxID=2070463 RepID=UPI0010CCCBD8|nr:hypothetical protein [Lysinibacillus sp. SGAir0095]QCR33113.1 hypothetical protein C1N55_13395 [Lysinibacillus sp. SGAir0095]